MNDSDHISISQGKVLAEVRMRALTPQEFMSQAELNAGRALDALIAERVMGHEGHNYKCGECEAYHVGTLDHPPHYSTSLADAWLVVERLGQYEFELQRHSNGEGLWNGRCGARFGGYMSGVQETASLAICLAALKAVGYD